MSRYIISKYTDYAIKNKVFSGDEIPDDDTLIVACNNFHQNYLLLEQNNGLGHKAATGCGLNPSAIDSNSKCGGVYTNGDPFCKCGQKWFWNSIGFDPRDLEAFDIENAYPYGYIETEK